MSKPNAQKCADLAADAYNPRKETTGDDTIKIGGHEYKVLAVHNNDKTGYYGAVYQDVKTNEIIVAHRGTQSIRDGAVDGVMVSSRYNLQADDAIILTRKAMEKVTEIQQNNPDLPKLTFTHTGHSLGGTLAQISAHYFNQEGITFNAYGAASLGRLPRGGDKVINYVKATDAVSAASPHYGKVVTLADKSDLLMLTSAGYTNSKVANALLPHNTVGTAVTSAFSAHSISNFTGPHSILSDPNARKLAEDNKVQIDAYRSGVEHTRIGISILGISPKNVVDFFSPERRPGEPAEKNLPPLTQDITQPLPKNASGQEFTDYGFAALLSDDDDHRFAALDSLMDSQVGQQLQQDARNAALAFDREQEQLRQQNAPVMKI
ncbi:MAG: lipase [Neisseria sp.]|uniref:lipase family protein n=1 Tax=Neisseria sp. TaxID=192066 RepID=UPI0026DD9081|nr:lipase [Neisseria sp.]MDO4641719.1 lipase [Neisseria sp.]